MTVRRRIGITVLIITAITALSLWIGTLPTAREKEFAQAAGTETSAIQLNTAADIIGLSETVNSGDNCEGKIYELTADIDLTDTSFSPIGLTTAFHGTIDGKGHTVTIGLTGYSNSAFVGTLGSSGIVKNLVLRGYSSGNGVVGGIVGENQGEIRECVSYAEITNTGLTQSYTGGIAAVNNKIISNCVNAGTINASVNAGGIVGNSSGTLTANISFGDVNTDGSLAQNIGGVAGIVSGSITDCYSYCDINVASTAWNYVGSVVGSTTSAAGKYNYAVASLYSFPASGSSGEVSGKFEKKYLYDFLSETGVVFSTGSYIRADFEQCRGYIYSPRYMTQNVDGKTVFINDGYEQLFGKPLFGAGVGSETDPYIIGGTEEWNLFVTNSKLYDYNGIHIKLNGTIEAGESYSAFSENTPFCGVFDGNGNSVTLSVNLTEKKNNVAVFGYVGNGTIENLVVKGNVMGGTNVGGAAGIITGAATINNVTNECVIAADANVGGIAGFVSSGASIVIENCINNGKITCTGIKDGGKTGGILGGAEGAVETVNCVNYASIVAENAGTTGIGGIIGEINSENSVIVENVHNEGTITASKTEGVGGIIGKALTGGIAAGENKLSAASVSSIADITGKTSVGGLFGELSGISEINAFASVGTVKGENYVSGVATLAAGEIDLTGGYASVTITESVGSGAAMFLSHAVVTVKNGTVNASYVYYNGDTVGKAESVSGVGRKNSIELTDEGLDFGTGNDFMTKYVSTDTDGSYAFPSANISFLKKSETLKVYYFDGTETDGSGKVYLLGSERAFINFVYLSTNRENYKTYSYKLVGNINMTKEVAAVPEFSGKIDGDRYTLTNLKVVTASGNAGFFGDLIGATVRNLRLDGGSVNGSGAQNTGSVGGYADENSIIEGSYASLTVNGGTGFTGGLVGENLGTIKESFFAGRITVASKAGGIAGKNQGTIENCFSSGKISGQISVGGIAAETDGGTINLCYVSGRIDGSGNAGGIAAAAFGSSVTKVYVISDFENTGTDNGAFFAEYDAGTVGTLTECYYNKDYISYEAYPGVVNNNEYGKEEIYFRTSGTGYFNVGGFKRPESRFNSEYDAYFAPYLEIFESKITQGSYYDEKTAYYVNESIEIAVFGKDTSSDVNHGSSGNPYLVTNATQFAMISELTRYTDFYGKYFYVTQDINMNETSSGSYGIGYYTVTGGNAFCGHIYGNESKRPTVSNLRIDKAANAEGTVTTSYIGVFANTEEGFSVRNIIFSGSVEGNSNVGGLIGYTHKGIIENCVSYINVTATGSGAGGLVGAISGGVTIKGSISAGTVTAAGGDAYGLIGVRSLNSGLTVTISSSWSVIKGNVASEYIHNSIGSVLYDYSDNDKGEELIIVDGGNEGKGFGFRLSSDESSIYKGRILDTADRFIAEASDTAYYDTTTDNVSREYCARYCTEINGKAIWEDDTDTAYATANVSGYYYLGQTITVSVAWTEEGKANGVKFVGMKDSLGKEVEYEIQPSANDILVSFVMNEDTTSVSMIVGAILSDEEQILSFEEASGTEYDGNARNPVLNGNTDGTMEYYLVSGEMKEEIKDAGEYRIVVRINDESGNYIGMYEERYTVAKRILTLNAAAESFSMFYSSTYDKDTAERTYEFRAGDTGYESCISGAANGEMPLVRLTFEYSDINVGENIGLKIVSSLSRDKNHTFTDEIHDLGTVGIITKKVITAELGYDEKKEDGTKVIKVVYSAGMPVIDAGIYEIGISLKLYDSDGEQVTSGFNVGEYVLKAMPSNTSDGNNYEVRTDGNYVVEISPYVVEISRLAFDKTVFEYTGNDLSVNIETYAAFTVPYDSNDHAVNLVFYKEAEGITETEVVNAGTYYAKANPIDTNYIIDEEAALTVITIEKKTVGALVLTLKKEDGTEINNGETVKVEDRILIDLSSDSIANLEGYDGVYRVETRNFNTELIGDKWYLVPVAGAENASFTIEGVSATNYNNRKSETFNLRIEKKELYGILEEDEFFYGDVIQDNLSLKYYYKETDGQGNPVLGAEVPKDVMTGLEEPGMTLGTDNLKAGTYTVTFSGGSSDGYVFEFYTSEEFGEKTVKINPKEIIIVVNDAGSKVYGEGNGTDIIPYIVAYEDENGERQTLETLPNGEEVVLNGLLGREKGEDVGEYTVNQGTLTGAETTEGTINNPDYRIRFEFNSKFAITKRETVLAIALNQGKEYGEEDGEIEMEPVEGYELVNNSALGIYDTMEVFKEAFTVYREEGEDTGSYAYRIDTDSVILSGLNYAVTVEDRTGNAYVISQAKPHTDFELTGTTNYGDETNKLVYSASAENRNGIKIEGEFDVYVQDYSAEGGKRYYLLLSDKTVIAEFTPEDKNYAAVKTSVSVTVQKRPVKVIINRISGDGFVSAEGAEFTYSGNAYKADAFSYSVSGTVLGNEEYDVKLTIEGDSKNVTKDGFTVKASLVSNYYVLNGESEVRCTVTKAVVTVKAAGGTIDYGEKFTPTIIYEGFVGGDGKSSLDKLATIENIPTESGYYTLMPSGAESDNYEFVYVAAVLVINRTEAEGDGIKIEGTLPPEYTISATAKDSQSAAFRNMAETMDAELGANFFIPLMTDMKEYVDIDAEGNVAAGSYTYTVKFENVNEKSIVYVRLANGKVEKVDFEIKETEDGKYVRFESEEIIGAAVYGDKGIQNLLLGFVPLAVACVAVVVLIAVIIAVAVKSAKKRKSVKYAAVRTRWK